MIILTETPLGKLKFDNVSPIVSEPSEILIDIKENLFQIIFLMQYSFFRSFNFLINNRCGNIKNSLHFKL